MHCVSLTICSAKNFDFKLKEGLSKKNSIIKLYTPWRAIYICNVQSKFSFQIKGSSKIPMNVPTKSQ